MIEDVLQPVAGTVAGVAGIVGGAEKLTGTKARFLTQERLGKLQRRLAPPPETLGEQVLFGVGQAVPVMATGAASLPVAAGAGALQHAYGAYQNTLQATGKEDEAKKALVLNLPVGLLEAALPGLSRLPSVSKVLTKLAPILARAEQKTGGAVSRAVLGAITEGTTEGAQRVLENAIADEFTSEERDLFAGAKEEGQVGGLVGLILNVAFGKRADFDAPQTKLEASLDRSRAIGEAQERGPTSGVPSPEAGPTPSPSLVSDEDITTQQDLATPQRTDAELFAELERDVPGYAEAVQATGREAKAKAALEAKNEAVQERIRLGMSPADAELAVDSTAFEEEFPSHVAVRQAMGAMEQDVAGRAEKLKAQGLSEEAAKRQAFRDIGLEEQTKETFVAPEPMKGSEPSLYHGGREPGLKELRSFTHFGTEKAARDRLAQLGMEETGALYEVAWRPSNPLRADSLESSDMAQAVRDALGRAGKKAAASEAQALIGRSDEASLEALAKILSREGYDGIVYRNEAEDVGQDSYISVAPVSTESRQEIPEAIEAQPRERVEELTSLMPPLFSRKPKGEPVPSEVNEGFDIPDESLIKRTERIAADSLNRIRVIQGVVQEQGGVVTEESDIATKADLFSGKMEEHQRRLNEEILDPLKTTAGRGDIKLTDIDEFLYARHAPTYNAIILERTKGKLEAGSGMTDAQAQAVLEKHKDNPRMKRIGEIVDAMNRETRAMLVDSGIISQETADAWREQFGDHYIPLKTDVDGKREGSGRGFSVPRGPFSKRAKGRRSLADSPLTFSVLQYQQAAAQAERNRVGQAVLSFVEKNPDENQWRSYAPGARPKDLPPLSPDRTLTVKVDGEPKVIEFNDPLIARALLNLGRTRGGRLMELLGNAQRIFSRLQTSWNPEFALPNPLRDLQTAGLNLTAEDSVGFAKKVTNPKSVYRSVRAIYRVIRDPKATGEYEQAFKEMRRSGGKVGWFHHKDFTQVFREIEQDLSSLEGEGALRKSWRGLRKLGDAIDQLNSSVENGVRLSAYLEAKKRGLSEQEASKLARGLTVDFNRKGEWGAAMNIAWLFYNASVQSTIRGAKALTKNPKRGATVVGTIASLGAMTAYLGYAFGGEDEDGIPFWDKIPERVKARNFVFLIPGWVDEDGAPKQIRIPMPYFYSLFNAMGRNAMEAALGTKKKGEASRDVFMSAAQNFSPIGSESSFTQLVSPTLLDPFVQISENKTWDNRPVYPDSAYDPYPKPDSQRFYANVSGTSKLIAQGLNKLTGGDEFEPGLVDISPESLDHLFEFAVGGAGRTGRRTINVVNKVLSGEKIEAHEIPLWRTIVGEHYNAYDRERFYNHLDEMAILEEKVRRVNGGSLSNKLTPDARALINDNRAAWRLRDEYHRKVGGKDSLQDRLKQARDAKDEKLETGIYLDFNKRWREATGRNP